MRDDQVAVSHALVAEQQDVDVDHARAPAPRGLPTSLTFHVFRRPQQLPRRAAPLALDDLVQELRLVGDSPRLGFYDAALPRDPQPLFPQAPPRGAEVAGPRPQVGSESEVDERQRKRSATRTARVSSSTSCTRTMSAPRSTAAMFVA